MSDNSLISDKEIKKSLIRTDDWLSKFLAITSVLELWILIAIVVLVPGAQEENQIIMMVIGANLAKRGTITDYFFSVSNSFKNNVEKEKNKTANSN